MSSLEIGYSSIGFLLVLVALRVPLAIALLLPSFLGIWAMVNWRAAWSLATSAPFEIAANWTLSAVPMFLFMGFICFQGRLTDGLFRLSRAWMGNLPGGIGISTIGGAALFSAITGSSVACAAAMGRIAVPEMEKRKYNTDFAAAICAAGGTLGAMIPPSILMIIYGTFAQVPIGQLFLAGFIPGALSACGFIVTILVLVVLRPDICPDRGGKTDWRERMSSILETWPFLLLVLVVMGGMFTGFFSATEAGAIGAISSLAIALVRRMMTWQAFVNAALQTVVSTAAILLITIGATLFTRLLALSGIAQDLADFAIRYADDPIWFVIGISVLFLILGMFLEPIGIMLLTLPLLLPVMVSMKIDLIWMGILVVKYLEIGMITPPVGMNLFVMKSVLGKSTTIEGMTRWVFWFIMADVVTMILLISFPPIVTFLPNLMK